MLLAYLQLLPNSLCDLIARGKNGGRATTELHLLLYNYALMSRVHVPETTSACSPTNSLGICA